MIIARSRRHSNSWHQKGEAATLPSLLYCTFALGVNGILQHLRLHPNAL